MVIIHSDQGRSVPVASRFFSLFLPDVPEPIGANSLTLGVLVVHPISAVHVRLRLASVGTVCWTHLLPTDLLLRD